jgi:predicted unusual protein kinase regulating ubiquinone biosynthesis (AarF/ABC1/UbiB family)
MAIRKIPTGRISRSVRLARLTASVGVSTLGEKIGGVFAGAAGREAKRVASQVRQAKKVAEALSEMKGAAMKLGQILSIHGEHLFPKEVSQVLAMLQQSSDELDFDEIERVVKRELGARYGKQLIGLSRKPIAAASIGQVHSARYRPEGGREADVAVKIQYPGVDKSIDSDVNGLASILSVLTRVPSVESFNSVIDEIKTILRQETDYLHEGESSEFFREFYSKDESLVVPRYFPEVSTKRVFTTSRVEGLTVQDFDASTASSAARSFVGRKFLEVFYTELFRAGKVQTDPNFANYKIQWSFGVSEPKLVLLDFGAVKAFDDEFRKDYRRLVRAALAGDYEAVREGAVRAGFLRDDDPKELVDMHWDLVRMFLEPFNQDRPYAWAENDLASRVARFMPKFIYAFKLRPPPRDFVFLNRKVVGAYFFCSAVKAEFSPRPLLEEFLAEA